MIHESLRIQGRTIALLPLVAIGDIVCACDFLFQSCCRDGKLGSFLHALCGSRVRVYLWCPNVFAQGLDEDGGVDIDTLRPYWRR